ncbi:hypothetical protein [Streptomyces chitinivorans]|uniref:hypothetical protein n=1 Tax=Streptomyces chitinivorans TaxID=1257027 RepID=UPI002446A88A|nr:hypothetical protein [Streptomyces chitinivorans]MDH2411563.1 hypothetical protein [Streptomyces chitinivorans]
MTTVRPSGAPAPWRPRRTGGAAGTPGPAAPSAAPRPGSTGHGAAGPDRQPAAAVAAAGITAVLAALFGDWSTRPGPLGAGLPGFPLPWGVTAGSPMLVTVLAGVFIALAGAPSFARTWAHTAASLAAAAALPALVRPPAGPDTVWAALSEAAHAGLFGVAAGWVPALAAYAVTRRRTRRGTGLGPYVWLTALTVVVPLTVLGATAALSAPGQVPGCSATECVAPRADLLFAGEITMRLALPAWAAGTAALAAARRSARVRGLRAHWQVLFALAATGLAVLFAPGLVLGASV